MKGSNIGHMNEHIGSITVLVQLWNAIWLQLVFKALHVCKSQSTHVTRNESNDTIAPIQTNNKGHNSKVPNEISPVIKLDLDLIPKSMYRKFGEDLMETVTVIEWTKPKRAKLTN